MGNLVTPIFTGQVHGRHLRFFRNPEDDAPSMPWCSIDDLHEALRLPRPIRRQLKRISQRHWADELETIATGDSVTTVGPHAMAQALIETAIEAGGAPQTIAVDYQHASAGAMSALTTFMPDTASLEYMVAAARQHMGLPDKAVSFECVDGVLVMKDDEGAPDNAN